MNAFNKDIFNTYRFNEFDNLIVRLFRCSFQKFLTIRLLNIQTNLSVE